MKAHRIRKAKTRYDDKKHYIFLEVEKNRWLEIESLDNVTYNSIQKFLKAEKDTGIKIVGFTETSFQVGTVKSWNHSGVILNTLKSNRKEI